MSTPQPQNPPAAGCLAVHFITKAFTHGKAIAAVAEGADVLKQAPAKGAAGQGVVSGATLAEISADFIDAMKKRHYDRVVDSIPA